MALVTALAMSLKTEFQMADEHKPPKGRRPTNYNTRDKRGLTDAQEQYARLRATGHEIRESAALMGMAYNTVRLFEKVPEVIARIEELNNQIADRVITENAVDRDWVMKNLVKVANRCMQEEPVRDKNGNPTGEYVFDSSGAINALKAIGQEVGMFKTTGTTINVNTQINQIPSEQLRMMVEGLAVEVLGPNVIEGQVVQH